SDRPTTAITTLRGGSRPPVSRWMPAQAAHAGIDAAAQAGVGPAHVASVMQRWRGGSHREAEVCTGRSELARRPEPRFLERSCDTAHRDGRPRWRIGSRRNKKARARHLKMAAIELR